MKNIKRGVLTSLIVFVLLFQYGSVQAQSALLQDQLNAQLKSLLIQLVEKLQNQLKDLLEQEPQAEEEDKEDYDPRNSSTYPVGSNSVVSKTSEAVKLGDDTIAVFTFEFTLGAIGDTFYINEDGSGLGVTLSAGTVISTSIADTTADLTSDSSYRINEGDSETFTVQVQVESSAAAGTPQSVQVTLDDVDYNTDSDLGGSSRTFILGSPKYKSAVVSVIDAN